MAWMILDFFLGIACSKICAGSSGDLTTYKIVCFLQISFNKLEISVSHYFGTGPTLLWYRGTVWYHQFGSVYFITVRSGWMDGY
jgi:hypothetical protein